MATSERSIESVVFQKFYADIHDGIQVDLNSFAVKLYSAELISPEIRDKATQVSAASGDRASTLLSAVEIRIKSNESKFWKFLEILEVYQEDLAKKLKEEYEYEKFKNKSEQCDGDPDPSLLTEPVRKLLVREEVFSSRPCNTDFPDGRGHIGQYGPQSDINVDEDLAEQAPTPEKAVLAPPQHYAIKQYNIPGLQHVSTGPGTQGKDEALNRFLKLLNELATEAYAKIEAELKSKYDKVFEQYEREKASLQEQYEREKASLQEHYEKKKASLQEHYEREKASLQEHYKREKASWQEAMNFKEEQQNTSETERKKKEKELAELRSRYHDKLVEYNDLKAQLAEKGELREPECRITELFKEIDSLEGSNEKELIRIRERLNSKIMDLKSSARRRKSISWP